MDVTCPGCDTATSRPRNFVTHLAVTFVLTAALWCLPGVAEAKIYYLKFEVQGGSHDAATTLASNAAANVTVSIVSTHPTDGPVHWKNSMIGASVTDNGTGQSNQVYQKNQGDLNNTTFYFADVPRTLTVVDNASGVPALVKFGTTQTFTGAPSFLLPDGLLVAPAVARTHSTAWPYEFFEVFLSAAMPVRPAPLPYNSPAGDFKQVQNVFENDTEDRVCIQGWMESALHPGQVEVWQTVPYQSGHNTSATNQSCAMTQVYRGPLSHIILER